MDRSREVDGDASEVWSILTSEASPLVVVATEDIPLDGEILLDYNLRCGGSDGKNV